MSIYIPQVPTVEEIRSNLPKWKEFSSLLTQRISEIDGSQSVDAKTQAIKASAIKEFKGLFDRSIGGYSKSFNPDAVVLREYGTGTDHFTYSHDGVEMKIYNQSSGPWKIYEKKVKVGSHTVLNESHTVS